MPIADWTVNFSLTSGIWSPTLLNLNQTVAYPSGNGCFLLRPDGCKLRSTVRAQKEDVPQADGSIMHCRYVSGMEMDLAIQLWEANKDRPACDDLLQEMLDDLMAYLYNLINAGDNLGRIQWTPDGASDQRMLDDIRLFTYPEENHSSVAVEIAVTVDTQWPYAANLTEEVTAPGVYPVIPGTVTNQGNRPTYPVWKVTAPGTDFTLANTSTGESFSWNGSLPGAGGSVDGTDYLEINTFKNTVYKNGVGSNLKGGIVMRTSEFFMLPPGANVITLSSGTGIALVNSAWS